MIDAIRGATAGAIATFVMDAVTARLLQHQPRDVTAREEEARPNGKTSVANFVDRLESQLGLSLSDAQKSLAANVVHYGLGAGPGAVYAILRRHLPLIGAGRGSVYGALLWALNDEYLNTRLGLAGTFDDYPLMTHWRGFVGHVALGVATDVGIDLLGAQRR